MVLFVRSIALALLLSQFRASEELRGSSAVRRLDHDLIAGYEPSSIITDHARIDLDQAAIVEQLGDMTATSFENAKAIYISGGHSKSYAKIKLTSQLQRDIKKGTLIEGTTTNGDVIRGKAFSSAVSGDVTVKMQYPIGKEKAPCYVGALSHFGQEDTSGCLGSAGVVEVDGEEYEYKYDILSHNMNGRTLQGFSTQAKEKMYDSSACTGCPYPEYKAFYEYYGEYDYADQWIMAAFDGKATAFDSRGNADFSKLGLVGRSEAVKGGIADMNVFMYVLRELHDAIDDCNVKCSLECADGDTNCVQCNDDAVEAWDEAVAFYTGSLVGHDGKGGGTLLYSLADKRGIDFRTCGVDGFQNEGTSKVNIDIMEQFKIGSKRVAQKKCNKALDNVKRISQLMLVPLIQGILLHAYKLDRLMINKKGAGWKVDADTFERYNAEGAAYAAAVLPMLHVCNEMAAEFVYEHMKIGSSILDFAPVKAALESNYACLGITCEDVGGIFDEDSRGYRSGAQPCTTIVQGDVSVSSSEEANGNSGFVGVIVGAMIGALLAYVFTLFALKILKREEGSKPEFSTSTVAELN